jgi:molybdenum cofactor cytidylyltransferase
LTPRFNISKKKIMDSAAAILMASGFSRRFGEKNKLLEPFRGKPLARHTLELVTELGAFFKGGIFLVSPDGETASLADGLSGLKAVRNRAPEKGQRESIRLGLEAAEAFAVSAYYMFFPCDQPFLDAGTVSLVLEARKRGRIVQPRCFNERGSPVLFCRSFRDELLNLAPGEHGRDIILKHPGLLITIDIPCPSGTPSPLTDIDDPETFLRYDEKR